MKELNLSEIQQVSGGGLRDWLKDQTKKFIPERPPLEIPRRWYRHLIR